MSVLLFAQLSTRFNVLFAKVFARCSMHMCMVVHPAFQFLLKHSFHASVNYYFGWQAMGIWSGLTEMACGYVATALVMLMSPALFPILAIIVPVRCHSSPLCPLISGVLYPAAHTCTLLA